MGSLIIALPKTDDAAKIGQLLKKHGFFADVLCSSGSEVLNKITNFDCGVVVCSNKLTDMSSIELHEYLPDYYDMVVISAEVSGEEDGIIRLCNPFKISDLVSTLEFLSSHQERCIRHKKDYKPKRASEDRTIIERAKQVLMERNDMTESEAYRYIQKCSMDSATNISETASMILMLSGIR